MATPFHVELVTPERVLFSGEADEVSLRADGGEIAFLAHHEDFIGAVDITVARISVVSAPSGEAGAGPLLAAVHGGFVHVDRDGVTILAGVAELGSEIDVERARAALASAGEAHGAGSSRSPGGAEEPGEDEGHPAQQYSGAMLALLAPESPEAARRRAETRLIAAGAAPAPT